MAIHHGLDEFIFKIKSLYYNLILWKDDHLF